MKDIKAITIVFKQLFYYLKKKKKKKNHAKGFEVLTI